MYLYKILQQFLYRFLFKFFFYLFRFFFTITNHINFEDKLGLSLKAFFTPFSHKRFANLRISVRSATLNITITVSKHLGGRSAPYLITITLLYYSGI